MERWLEADGRFETFLSLARSAELTDLLRSSTKRTVFAPTDDACRNLEPAALSQLLQGKDKELIRRFIRSHVLADPIVLADLRKSRSQKTMHGQVVSIFDTASVVSVDWSPIIDGDKKCSNGVIHVISSAMWPSDKDVYETVKAEGCSLMMAILDRAGMKDTLKGPLPITLLAPTDAALKSLPAERLDRLMKSGSKDEAVTFVNQHLIIGRVFCSTAPVGSSLKTMAGTSLLITTDGTARRIKGVALSGRDRLATNGVLVVLQGVLE